MRQRIHSSITWALFKIKADKAYLGQIIGVVDKSSYVYGLTRYDAVNLLASYGHDRAAIDALFRAFQEKDFLLSAVALDALRRIFRDNEEVSDILNMNRSVYSSLDKNSVVARVKISLGY